MSGYPGEVSLQSGVAGVVEGDLGPGFFRGPDFPLRDHKIDLFRGVVGNEAAKTKAINNLFSASEVVVFIEESRSGDLNSDANASISAQAVSFFSCALLIQCHRRVWLRLGGTYLRFNSSFIEIDDHRPGFQSTSLAEGLPLHSSPGHFRRLPLGW